MPRKKYDNSFQKLYNILDYLFLDETFQTGVSALRSRFKIPSQGFSSGPELIRKWFDPNPHINRHVGLLVNTKDVAINDSVFVDMPWELSSFWIAAYVLLGSRYKEYNSEDILKLHKLGSSVVLIAPNLLTGGVLLDRSLGTINIPVLNGASKNDLLEFIDNNWNNFQSILKKEKYSLPKFPPKPAISKCIQAYNYYKKGFLTKSGKVTEIYWKAYENTADSNLIVKSTATQRRKYILAGGGIFHRNVPLGGTT